MAMFMDVGSYQMNCLFDSELLFICLFISFYKLDSECLSKQILVEPSGWS